MSQQFTRRSGVFLVRFAGNTIEGANDSTGTTRNVRGAHCWVWSVPLGSRGISEGLAERLLLPLRAPLLRNQQPTCRLRQFFPARLKRMLSSRRGHARWTGQASCLQLLPQCKSPPRPWMMHSVVRQHGPQWGRPLLINTHRRGMLASVSPMLKSCLLTTQHSIQHPNTITVYTNLLPSPESTKHRIERQ